MRLKSYFVDSVEAAMAQASVELGPEAMLVQSKKSTQDALQPGRYEVVFALEEPVAKQGPVERETSRPGAAGNRRDPVVEQLCSELEQLKKQMGTLSGALGTPAAPKAKSPARDPLAERLALAEVDPELVRAILKKVSGVGDGSTRRKIVEGFLRLDPTLGIAGAKRKVVALVGPSGAGKTTALIKLAIRYGLTARRTTHVLSTDVFRVGGAEPLRLYSSLLGISFGTAETPLELAQALESQRQKRLILIDTPGNGSRDGAELRELAAYISGDPEIDVHLVLPASTRACDQARLAQRYGYYGPRKLLFTRLDETERHGALLNESHRTGKPVSFLCNGDRIPEDLEAATTAGIMNLILGSEMTPGAGLRREETQP